jgi:3D (Asp-Asp-Asp) domain-containing protein
MRDLVKKSTFSSLAVLVVSLSFIQQQTGETSFSTDSKISQKEIADAVKASFAEEAKTAKQTIEGQIAQDRITQNETNLEMFQKTNQVQSNEQNNKDSKNKDSRKELKTNKSANKALSDNNGADSSKTSESARTFTATAYCLRGKTASGVMVRHGIIAADPKVLPMGSLVQLTAGSYSGTYVVADTGNKVKGRKIDIWVPKCLEAIRFGRRSVKLTVIQEKK